jgi:hypothetical protein
MLDEGTGQVVGDGSGNGLHATLGDTSGSESSDPTWITEGLSFDGGDFVHTPVLPAIYGVDIVFKPPAAWSAATTALGLCGPNHTQTHIAVGNQSGLSNEVIMVRQSSAAGYPTSGIAYWQHASDTISNVWHLLQCDVRPASAYWTIKLDGTEKRNQIDTTPPGGFLTDDWFIGKAFSVAAVPSGTEIACVILYGDQGGVGRDDAQQAAARTALTAALAGRGITLP